MEALICPKCGKEVDAPAAGSAMAVCPNCLTGFALHTASPSPDTVAAAGFATHAPDETAAASQSAEKPIFSSFTEDKPKEKPETKSPMLTAFNYLVTFVAVVAGLYEICGPSGSSRQTGTSYTTPKPTISSINANSNSAKAAANARQTINNLMSQMANNANANANAASPAPKRRK